MSECAGTVTAVTKPSGKTAVKRPASSYACTECGMTSIRWVGRCPECQAWGSMAEEGVRAAALTLPAPVTPRVSAEPIGQAGSAVARAVPTGLSELDRVLGGGLVPGSVLLLGGEPGVGKSTLLLEVGRKFAELGG